ncbi:Endospore coat-associated protein YheC/D [Pseudobacteroides cellulosolvens ATCC 35603 = DSM 2933]|uniref:Endospore coat-associated protein YheC/D n=2 Tax=Pseudobacteroides cellulosolvens TaxID=35825 RepID=A0A0L6JH78_9FIRM|nr:Endospore coat-associated protein YheC/D [Pseudobacteroides cellulosolvens ATCC 35603 = DSM 2933]
MWVKFKLEQSDKDIIFLPLSMMGMYPNRVFVCFGGKTVNAVVKYSEFFDLSINSTYEDPGIIGISIGLRNKLLVPEMITYRICVERNAISIGPVIGLLLGNNIYRYSPRHMEKYSDRFGIYDKVGGLIYAFSPRTVNWKKRIAFGLYYDNLSHSWDYGYFPLPEVIYRRDFHSNSNDIKRLIKETGGRLFNSCRFTKFEMYKYMNKNEELRDFLPPTQLTQDFGQIISFIDKHVRVILKPIDLSRGRGILIIEKDGYNYKVTDYRMVLPVVTTYRINELREFFNQNNSLFNKYLLQQFLSLATIDGCPFDIRVVMQKRADRIWRCSGIECRVSKNGSHLTNISRGGYALSFDKAIQRSFGEQATTFYEGIVLFCRKFCNYMDKSGEHFSEFGIDVAIDVNQNLWLIEANVFPSFKGFKKIDLQSYFNIRYAPFLYALSLTKYGDCEELT